MVSETLETAIASYLIRVRPSGILAELLAMYLNSSMGRSWIKSVASQQVGQANVNGSKLRALGIPLPPFAEQAEMLRRLNAIPGSSPHRPPRIRRPC
jgi:type I restriction enzyme S subunit